MRITIDLNENNISELLDAISMLQKMAKIYVTTSQHSIHPAQARILELGKQKDIGTMTLREIGEEVGYPHPQQIAHHLEQLKRKGLIDTGRRLVCTKAVDGRLSK